MNSSAFAVHAYERGDLVRADPWFERFAEQEIEQITPILEPVFMGEVVAGQGPGSLHCDVFIAPLLPYQVIASRELAGQRVESMARMSRGMGNRVMGLGALLGVVAERTEEIESRVAGIRITSGNALTAATVVRGTLGLAEQMSLDLTRHPVAVVGASGSLGRLCALLLSREGCRVTLVGRNRRHLSEVQAEISTDLDQTARQSRAVVLAVSVSRPFDQDDLFAREALVVDASQPKSISRRLADSRPDLTWARGIYLRPKGELRISCELRLPEGVLYPCLVESMLLGQEEPPGFTWVGRRIPPEAVDWTWERAQRLGFGLHAQMTPTKWDR